MRLVNFGILSKMDSAFPVFRSNWALRFSKCATTPAPFPR